MGVQECVQAIQQATQGRKEVIPAEDWVAEHCFDIGFHFVGELRAKATGFCEQEFLAGVWLGVHGKEYVEVAG